MSMIWQTVSESAEQTKLLGERLGRSLSGGEVIELRSDLGGGKTTFVKGLAKGAGSQANVTSPSFTLSRIYQAQDFSIYHYDLYRLNDAGILADQLAESLNDDKAVTVVEWADIVKSVLPAERLSIEFKPTVNSPDERQISFSYPNSARQIITALQSQWPQIRP